MLSFKKELKNDSNKIKMNFIKLLKNPVIINLFLMLVVSVGLVFGTLAWLDNYTRHNEAVVVPDVKGLTVPKAAEFFTTNGLRYSVVDSVFSKSVAPGAIVDLKPEVGSKVKEGRIVYITVNALSAQTAVLPDVQDLSFRQAYALLKASGFTKIEVVYRKGAYDDLSFGVENNGHVLSPGSNVPLTAPLELFVSKIDLEEPTDSTLVLDSVAINDNENWF
jgi:beta-lactam-binding protein with PASTA domain